MNREYICTTTVDGLVLTLTPKTHIYTYRSAILGASPE